MCRKGSRKCRFGMNRLSNRSCDGVARLYLVLPYGSPLHRRRRGLLLYGMLGSWRGVQSAFLSGSEGGMRRVDRLDTRDGIACLFHTVSFISIRRKVDAG